MPIVQHWKNWTRLMILVTIFVITTVLIELDQFKCDSLIILIIQINFLMKVFKEKFTCQFFY